MGNKNPPWTKDELVLALDLYLRVGFGSNAGHVPESHPEVVALSQLLNRLPFHDSRPDAARFRNANAVHMKLSNFLRLDPAYPGAGLRAGSKKDVEVWNEFANDRNRLRSMAAAIRSFAQPYSIPDKPSLSLEEEDEAPEGRVLLRQHRIRERNAQLVRKKRLLALKRTGTLDCQVCGFDFGKRYGSLGDGFIECHHTVPLHLLRPAQVTRLQDLSLVCANCHRMLHRGAGTTVESLSRLVHHTI